METKKKELTKETRERLSAALTMHGAIFVDICDIVDTIEAESPEASIWAELQTDFQGFARLWQTFAESCAAKATLNV